MAKPLKVEPPICGTFILIMGSKSSCKSGRGKTHSIQMPEFINAWWDTLSFALKMFYGIGIIALFALAIQVGLSLIVGIEDGIDVGNHDSGMGILSIRGITAFFVGLGWAGVVLMQQGLALPMALFLSLLVGFGMMVAIYFMMRTLMKMEDSGSLDYANAVGQMGTVYVTIPPVKRPGGQVETMIQGRLVTAEALQRGSEPLKPGTKVQVVEKVGASTLIVEPVENFQID